MKAKALLLAAAVLAVGATTSMAQVYSANAVGYVNLTLPPGFSLIANPLDNTNNGLNTLLPGMPNNSRVYRFDNGANYVVSTYLTAVGRWTSNMVFNPGDGFFVFVAGANPVNVTFVGEVPQGNLVNDLTAGIFQIKGSQVPQALPLGRPNSTVGVATLEYPAVVNDQVFLFSNTTGYSVATYRQIGPNQLWTGTGVTADGPVIPVAAGFFLFRAPAGTADWTRTFSVN